MTTEQLLPLLGFVTVMTATPGPNNLMLMASGANAGFRRSLPHIFGIAVGCQIILLCVALGLGQLLTQWPGALDLLRVVGALYLLYLAWQLVRSNPVQSTATQTKPFTFTQAALFQWVNPKAWMMILTGVATFTNPQDFTISVAIVAGAFLMIGLPLISSWSLFGAILGRLLKSPLRTQSFRLVRNLGALLKVYVDPSKKRNNECGPAWKTRRARPEAHICCALPLGKGTTLPIETRHNSCTLQATLSMQGAFQQPAKHWLTQGQRLRTFNRIMASLLVASLIPTFGLQASEDPHAAQEPVAQTQSPPQQPTTPPPGQREPWWLSVM